MDITLNIPLERISDLFISALEGGSNYWYMIEKEMRPIEWTFENDGGERYKKTGEHWSQDYPFNKGGSLYISNEVILDEGEEKTTKRVGLKDLQEGMILFSKQEPAAFGRFLAEEEDGCDADLFLQCVVLGKVIYG